jgi:AhpD family alkylhydroperoxidase
MGKIEDIKKTRQWAHDFLLDKKSEVYEKFLEMEKATYKDGAVSRKNKELIAVGISVVINCESCMQWHVEQALICGANEKELIEAVEVGLEMGGGPATAHSRFALEVLDRFIRKRDPK